jgi:uncharacterized membrane protein
MRKAFCALAVLMVAAAGAGYAQQQDHDADKPKYYRLGIRWDGVATCYWEGNDCIVT